MRKKLLYQKVGFKVHGSIYAVFGIQHHLTCPAALLMRNTIRPLLFLNKHYIPINIHTKHCDLTQLVLMLNPFLRNLNFLKSS